MCSIQRPLDDRSQFRIHLEAEAVLGILALHLALAVEAKVDYLCTCGDKFLKRAKAADTESVRVVSPLELIEEIEL